MSETVRDLQESDLDQVLAMEAELFGATAWNRDLFLDEIGRMPNSRWYQVLVEENQVIGYIGLAFAGTTADIQTIGIAPARQRTGLGSKLLNLALTEAKKRGVEQVFLEVAVENAPAISLYKDFGFNQISIRPNYYGAGKNAYVMMRGIGEA